MLFSTSGLPVIRKQTVAWRNLSIAESRPPIAMGVALDKRCSHSEANPSHGFDRWARSKNGRANRAAFGRSSTAGALDFALRYATDPKMDTRRVPRLCAGNGRPSGGRALSQRALMFVVDRKIRPGFYPSSGHDHSDPNVTQWPMDVRRSPRSSHIYLSKHRLRPTRPHSRERGLWKLGGSAVSRKRNWNGG